VSDVVRGNWLSRYFRRLRWKLTASYTLVTVAVLLVLELLAIVALGVVVIVVLSQNSDIVLEETDQEVSLALGEFLAGPQPDLAGIHTWLDDVRRNGIRPQQADVGVHITANDLAQPGTRMIVVDRQRRVLGELGQATPPRTLLALDQSTVPDLSHLLPRALAGDPQITPLIDWPIPDHITAAVPIRDENGTVRGALVFTGPYRLIDTPVQGIAIALGVSALVFTALAGLVGTVFGFFAARGLTRRLGRMSTAATAWGAGDFERRIKDSSLDEIGQLARQLNRMAEQLEELIATRQQLSVADERNRLARDLHDSVKQQAFAISMNLGAARALLERNPHTARERIDAAYEIARQSQQELAAIIQTLRPVQLEEGGLREALAEYVSRWQAQTGLSAHFEVTGESDPPREVEDALFRVAQEALANVARHSRASIANVRVTLGTDAAELHVEDNGRGFDPRRAPAGVGLHSMRERIEALGGAFTIASNDDGTRLTARVPLHAEERTQP
jgi:NarL family two-component system sensor histidine kinase LiaS